MGRVGERTVLAKAGVATAAVSRSATVILAMTGKGDPPFEVDQC
jgi:hypothetical protein